MKIIEDSIAAFASFIWGYPLLLLLIAIFDKYLEAPKNIDFGFIFNNSFTTEDL